MPSVSKAQAKFFAWMSHDAKAAKEHGLSTEKAKEWHSEDKKTGKWGRWFKQKD